MNLFAFTLAAIAELAPGAPPDPRLADAIATAAEERSILRGDVDGLRTAALLVVTGFDESRFVATSVGDDGRTCGVFGIWVGRSERRCRAIQEDVYGAARIARDLLADSFGACSAYPEAERMGVYLGGACDRGLRQSRRRWWLTRRLLRDAVTAANDRRDEVEDEQQAGARGASSRGHRRAPGVVLRGLLAIAYRPRLRRGGRRRLLPIVSPPERRADAARARRRDAAAAQGAARSVRDRRTHGLARSLGEEGRTP